MQLPARPGLSAPLEVFWTLSGLCNLKCTFCMTSSGPAPARPGLGAEDRARLAEQLVEARVLKVYLTGGEPLVLPDYFELQARLLGAGIFVELTTNGTRLDPATCARLKAAGLPSIQVSLNGSDARVNDPLMGEGTFASIRAGIRNAVDAGLDLHARPTVTAENVGDIPALIAELADLGVPRIDLKEISPLGRAAARFPSMRVDLDAVRRLEDYCRDFSHPATVVDFQSWSSTFEGWNHPAECNLGDPRPATVLIDEAGHLAGCSATFYLGFENPVLEHGLLGAWDRLPELARFRDPDALGGECGTCDIVATCKGGCRAAAARLTGDVHAPDPLCPRVEFEIPERDEAELANLTHWKVGE